MCLSCEPYRPGREDTRSTTEADAGKFEAQRVEQPYYIDSSGTEYWSRAELRAEAAE